MNKAYAVSLNRPVGFLPHCVLSLGWKAASLNAGGYHAPSYHRTDAEGEIWRTVCSGEEGSKLW